MTLSDSMSLVLKQVETNWQILILFLKKYFYPQTVKKHQKGLRKRDSLVLLPRFSSIWDKVSHSARKVSHPAQKVTRSSRKTSTQRESPRAPQNPKQKQAAVPCSPLEKSLNSSFTRSP
jgi:hypothetical protein